MDGQECKEILYSDTKKNKDFRADSQFYTTKTIRNKNLRYVPIGNHLSSTQYGVSKDMNTEGIGYPIFRMNEIHHSLCDLVTEKFVELTDFEFADVKLNNRDVLFNRTNSYGLVGRTGVYYDHGVPQTFASYLVRLVPDNTQLYSEYLAAFLNTRHGIREIRRRARQSINQTNVNPEEVKAIEIPLLAKEFQEQIKECYQQAHILRLDSSKRYSEAEKFLDEQLGFNGLEKGDNSTAIKQLSKSFNITGRLDAEYYQPKYDVLFDKLKDHLCKRLGGSNGVVNIKKSIEPGSEAYQDTGIPFVRVSDVTKHEITAPEIHLSHSVVENVASLYPRKDTILFSKDGSVGIAYKLECDEEIITSSALLHLIIKDTSEIMPDYLTLVLNSPVVQMQAERDSNGAIIQHWKPSEIENVIIPVLDVNKQKEIAARVQKSFDLKRQSKLLLEYAKHAVELAIEHDENTALTWLRNKISQLEV